LTGTRLLSTAMSLSTGERPYLQTVMTLTLEKSLSTGVSQLLTVACRQFVDFDSILA